MCQTNKILEGLLRTTFRPPPKLMVSEWADAYRQLSSEASSEPGRWYTSRAEYQRGIMDAINEPGVERVVVMTSSQVGKTEIELNLIGYFMHQDPSPILVVYPTLDMAYSFSSDRLQPMIRDTKVLTGLFKRGKQQGTENTKLHKQFPGGHITMVGSNSPAGLAARPIRVVVFDEVDRFPQSSGGKDGDGDVISLAEKRTKTFFNRVIVMVSTPTIKGISRIEMAYEESDKRGYYVPCPHCNEFQVLAWAQVTWDKDDNGEHMPDTAAIACVHCGVLLYDKDRRAMVKRGEWRKAGTSGNTAGFHLNELYSPWGKLSEIVREHLSAKKSPERLKAWINTTLGEAFEEQGDNIDSVGLMERREEYDKVPSSVGVLVCSVDVQDDRLEYLILGVGRDNEVWAIVAGKIHGDPAMSDVWQDLDTIIFSRYLVEDGASLPIACTVIDTGGNKTQDVYQYVKTRERYRVYGIKGSSQLSSAPRPLVATRNRKKNGVSLFGISVDTGKDMLFSRLNIDTPGPAYIHFNRSFTDEFFVQFAAEKRIIKYHKGFPRREYVKTTPRNEAIDLFVYAFAALEILNVKDMQILIDKRRPLNLPEDAPRIEENIPTNYEPPLEKKPRRRKKPAGGNFATSW